MRVLEADQSLTEEQHHIQRKAAFKRVSELQSKMLANTVIKIVVPEGEVDDRQAIADFIANTSAAWLKLIDEKQREISNAGLDKTVPVVCDACGHGWETAIEFDPTTFFGQGSSE